MSALGSTVLSSPLTLIESDTENDNLLSAHDAATAHSADTKVVRASLDVAPSGVPATGGTAWPSARLSAASPDHGRSHPSTRMHSPSSTLAEDRPLSRTSHAGTAPASLPTLTFAHPATPRTSFERAAQSADEMHVHTHSGAVATDSSSDRPTGESSGAVHALASEGSSTRTFEATFEGSSASLQQSAPTQWRSDDADTATPSASGLVTSSRTARAGGPSSSPSFTLCSAATSIVGVERLTAYASSADLERLATKMTVDSVSSDINASASTHAVPALSSGSSTPSFDKGDTAFSSTASHSSSTASVASHEASSPSLLSTASSQTRALVVAADATFGASLPGSTDSASSSSSSSALSPGDIGAIVGGIVAFVGLALLVFVMHRRRRRSSNPNVYSGVDAAVVDDPFRPEMREALDGSAGYARSASYSSLTQGPAAWDTRETPHEAPAALKQRYSGADDDRRSLLRAAEGYVAPPPVVTAQSRMGAKSVAVGHDGASFPAFRVVPPFEAAGTSSLVSPVSTSATTTAALRRLGSVRDSLFDGLRNPFLREDEPSSGDEDGAGGMTPIEQTRPWLTRVRRAGEESPFFAGRVER